MTSTLTVDYDELMRRADEVEAPVPGLPTENAQSPCLLQMAITATEQLGLSADNMRTFLRTGIEREWPKLADTIREVAKAYEEVDETAATALDNETSVSAASHSFAADDLSQVMLTTTQAAESFPPEYQDLKERAWEIEQTDRGASLDNFAAAWSAYQRTLLQTVDRFRPFDTYDGEAAYALEQEMEQQRQWVYAMADLCQTMIDQAQTFASTHRWALTQHILEDEYKLITYSYLVEFEEMYEKYPEYRNDYMQYYVKWQQQSDEVMDEYQNQATLPLPPINPATPPYVHAPGDAAGGGGLPSGNSSNNLPDGLPSEPAGGHGGAGAAAADTADTSDDGTPTDLPAYPGTVPPLSAGPGVKPASVSGGGVGMPAMPLQPPIEPDGTPRPSAAAPGGALFGAGPGGRGAMGGGAGMPMGGHGGQNQNDKKGKRVDQDEEALYTEDRQWTAPVIGNRRRNDLPDGGEAPMPAAS